MKSNNGRQILAAVAAAVATLGLALDARGTTVLDPCDIDSTHRPSLHCPDQCPTDDNCVPQIEENWN